MANIKKIMFLTLMTKLKIFTNKKIFLPSRIRLKIKLNGKYNSIIATTKNCCENVNIFTNQL